ncbi:MAG: 3-keto-5-aminohexanoate cleavage protein, partial [Candidatus Competibacteraceae bacterium]|nr:3-keto-5-aminohexanoate cleavage protein [Candidatus Competibacteraceae bacterium]
MNRQPLIINVAPNGARRTHADHPKLPITPQELAETAKSCLQAGAAMLHLHVRDVQGGHTLDVEAYRAAMAAVEKAVGKELIVQATSEAVGLYRPEQQMAMVRELRPEAVSLAVREIAPAASDEPKAADFLAWLVGVGIHPQFILYSPGDIARFKDLLERGVVPQRQHFVLYVLGRYSAG